MEMNAIATSNVQEEMFKLKRYKVRSGTIDSGKDYEVKIAALLALKCCSEGFQDFWLAINVDGCGALDDIIMYNENNNDEGITYFMQLKHQDNSKTIPKQSFLDSKGDFSLHKYSKCFTELKDLISGSTRQSPVFNHLRQVRKMKYIIFTNRKVAGTFEFLNEVGEIPQINFIRTKGSAFKFDYKKLPLTLKLHTKFMKNLFLFTNQPHIKNIENEIKAAIGNFLGPLQLSDMGLTDIAHKFVSFIGEWSKGNLDGHYVLTQNHILKKLTELLLCPYTIKLEQPEEYEKNKEDNIWNDLISDKDVIVVDEVDDVVERYLNNYTYNVVVNNKDSINSVTAKNEKLLRVLSKPENLSVGDIYELLWKTRQIPLLVEVCNKQSAKQIQEILKISQGVFRVVVLNKTDDHLENLSAKNLFNNMKDLNKHHQEQILKLPVSLQGRRLSSLQRLKIDKEQLFGYLKVKDIVHILCGQFNIGEEFEELPEFFVEMSLTKNWLDITILKEVTDDIFVVKCEFLNSTEEFLCSTLTIDKNEIVSWSNIDKNTFKSRIIIFDLIKHLQKIEKFCLTLNKTVHFVVWHGSDNLEWMKSNNTVENIGSYKKSLASSQIESIIAKEAMANFCRDRNTLLVSANPGMGKSVLINYFAHNIPTDLWVLKVNLPKHKEHYKNWCAPNCYSQNLKCKHFKEFLEEVLKEQLLYNNITKAIFEQYLISKNIVLLLDGFDEIPVNSQMGAKNLIKFIRESQYLICVTTRPLLKTELEIVLNTFAVTLNKFTMNEQMYFLTHYFAKLGKIVASNPKVISFVTELLEATRKNLNDFDNQFTGVPLQTILLAQVFTRDFKEYLQDGIFKSKHFDLIYLYGHFITEKIKIALDKVESISEDMINQYKMCRSFYALKLLFLPEDLKELKLDENLEALNRMLLHAMQTIQKDGIVVTDGESNVSFVHQTYAEYLAAEWLSENINTAYRETVQNLVKKTFAPRYSVVRNIFDRILAKNCPLHTAIINRQINIVKEIITSDENAICIIDDGGRTTLHLIAAWGLHHPRPFKEMYITDQMVKQDDMTIILKLLTNNKLACVKDNILHYTPLDYAIISGSLHIANKICSQMVNSHCCVNINDADTNLLLAYVNERYSISLYSVILRCRVKTYFELVHIENSLYNAISKGDIESVRLLISQENINSKDCNGCTPLHIAAKHGHTEITKILLSKEAIVNVADDNGRTPLHWATFEGHADIVSLLVTYGSDITATDYYRRTAIHYAIISSSTLRYKNICTLIKHLPSTTITTTSTTTTSTTNSTATTSGGKRIRSILECRDKYKMNALHWAVLSDQVDVIKLLLSQKMNANAKSWKNMTALFFAIECNNMNTVNFLLHEGANTEAINSDNQTALHYAAHKGHKDIVNLLLVNIANIKAVDNNNRTPLHRAAYKGHKDIVNLLLIKGANLEAVDKFNRTPMHLATCKGHTDIVNLLLINGANIEAIDKYNESPLHWAARKGHTDLVNLLLINGANITAVDKRNETPLDRAADKGHKDVVNSLLIKGANINAVDNDNRTPLHKAAYNGHKDIVNLLLKNGANIEAVDKYNKTALHSAAVKDHKGIVNLLLINGAKITAVDKPNETSLLQAAGKGHKDVVNSLLIKGVNINAVDNYNRTPLHKAAYHGHKDLVNLLLINGANITAVDKHNETPLHRAAVKGHKDVVNLLLINGANINAVDNFNRTLLHKAAYNGHKDIVNLLLINGANIEAVDKYNKTALHSAAVKGHKDVVNLLLIKGANINAVDNFNRTPLHKAAYNGHKGIVNLLLLNGANILAINELNQTSFRQGGK